MNPFTEEKNRRIVDAIALILIGLFMCFFTNISLDVFTLVAGITCLVFGSFYLFAYFWSFIIHDAWLLLRGIFMLLVGVLILSYPGAFVYFMVYTCSFYLMFSGVEEIAYAIDLSRLHVKNWWLDLLNGIILFGLGLTLIIVDALNGNSPALLSIFAGASLALEGTMELILIFCLHRDFKRVKKNVVSDQ
jgi:uncharacterized membrane protein HdeD (DUF308 family)